MKKHIITGAVCAILVLTVFIIVPPPFAYFNESKIHLSFDDVEFCLKDLSQNEKYKSLFEQPFFAYVKELHDKYGVEVTLYTYANGSDGWTIEQMTTKYKDEFINSKWLKMGFHATSPTISKDSIANAERFVSDFNRVNDAIASFASMQNVATTLRLHYFFATPDEVKFMRMGGVRELLSADDMRISYSLDSVLNDELIRNETIHYDNVKYKRTDIRVEKTRLPNISLIKNTNEEDIVIFTHEWALSDLNKLKLEYMLWRITF